MWWNALKWDLCSIFGMIQTVTILNGATTHSQSVTEVFSSSLSALSFISLSMSEWVCTTCSSLKSGVDFKKKTTSRHCIGSIWHLHWEYLFEKPIENDVLNSGGTAILLQFKSRHGHLGCPSSWTAWPCSLRRNSCWMTTWHTCCIKSISSLIIWLKKSWPDSVPALYQTRL